MTKNELRNAFKSTPLKQALQKPPVEEYTPDQVKLTELGIPKENTKTLTLGWKARHGDKKKVFHPNNSSFDNLTKGFWTYVMDTIYNVNLLKIDTTLLPEPLAEMTLKQIDIKGLQDDSPKQIKELQDLIELLQKDGNDILKLLEWLYDFMNSGKMSFFDLNKFKKEFDEDFSYDDLRVKDIRKEIENYEIKISKKEVERIKEIEEVLKND